MEIWSDQHMLCRISGGELRDLNYILTQPVHWIALSFVRQASDVVELKEKLELSGSEKGNLAAEKAQAARDAETERTKCANLQRELIGAKSRLGILENDVSRLQSRLQIAEAAADDARKTQKSNHATSAAAEDSTGNDNEASPSTSNQWSNGKGGAATAQKGILRSQSTHNGESTNTRRRTMMQRSVSFDNLEENLFRPPPFRRIF